MAVMEFKRRSKGSAVPEIAAAAAFNISNPRELSKLRSIVTVSKARTNNCWDWYDKIGEIRYAVNRNAKVAGHAVLGAYERKGTDFGDALPLSSKAQQILAGVWSPNGGQRHLIQSFFRLMRMPGQAHLIRLPRGPKGESGGYEFISDNEISVEDGICYRQTLPVAQLAGFSEKEIKESTRVEIAPEDYLGRVWMPHPQYSDMPDSPMYALDDVCEELYLLTAGVKAKLKSRLLSAGVWYIPSEVSEVQRSGLTQDDGDKPAFSSDAVMNAFITALVSNRVSFDDALAFFPILVRGPGEQADNFQFKIPDLAILEVDIRLREEALGRVLHGLDAKPSSVKGNADTNHWGAWADRDEDLKENVIPDLEMLAWTIEQLVLVPELEAAGEPTDNVGVWFDLSEATSRPNVGEDARQGYEMGAVSGEGFRHYVGIDDQYEPSEEEYVRWLGQKIGDPYLATYGLKIAGSIDWDKVAVKSDQAPGPEPEPKPGRVGPGNPGADGTTGKNDSSKPRSQRPAA